MWASLHTLSYLSISASPSSKSEWISLLFAPCQASVLFVWQISKTNRQSHERESPGASAGLLVGRLVPEASSRVESCDQRQENISSANNGRRQGGNPGDGCGDHTGHFQQHAPHREGEAALSLPACREKGQWTAEAAAQQDVTAVLTQHRNNFNLLKDSCELFPVTPNCLRRKWWTCWPHCHTLPGFSPVPNPPFATAELWVHATYPDPCSSTRELPSSSTGRVSPGAERPGARARSVPLRLIHPPGPCPLADPLQGPPKGTLCCCYLGSIKQFRALSLWYSTSTTVRGDAQKTKPVNWSLLKITLWNKNRRLNLDLFTEGLMPPFYLLRARTGLSQHRDLYSISLPADNNPAHPFCLPREHPNCQVQLLISPGKALPSRVKRSFIHSAKEDQHVSNGLKFQIVVTTPTTL